MNDIAGTIEVEIERMLPGGLGLAHAEGRTVLVPLAAPGDLVRVRIDRVRGKTTFATIVEIIKPSPVRVEPPCPYFGSCGGCDFQQLSYEAQLKAKSDMIRDCFYRIARIEDPPEISVLHSPREWRYRARANWQLDPKTRRIGYFERGTHKVCDVADCAVLVPELQTVLETIRNQLQLDFPEEVTEIEAVAGDSGVSLHPEIGGYKTQDLTRRIGNETYQFSTTSFFQINHDLLETLVHAAVDNATGQKAVDLYSGVGLFTLPLARRFSEVVAIEGSASACRYARRNLAGVELDNARIINARVSEWVKRPSIVGSIDFLLLDPPRIGAEPKVVQSILNFSPQRICYVSCDPATLARDLKDFLAGGYRLQSVAAFDMFPQTHHVETVVHLSKR